MNKFISISRDAVVSVSVQLGGPDWMSSIVQ